MKLEDAALAEEPGARRHRREVVDVVEDVQQDDEIRPKGEHPLEGLEMLQGMRIGTARIDRLPAPACGGAEARRELFAETVGDRLDADPERERIADDEEAAHGIGLLRGVRDVAKTDVVERDVAPRPERLGVGREPLRFWGDERPDAGDPFAEDEDRRDRPDGKRRVVPPGRQPPRRPQPDRHGEKRRGEPVEQHRRRESRAESVRIQDPRRGGRRIQRAHEVAQPPQEHSRAQHPGRGLRPRAFRS